MLNNLVDMPTGDVYLFSTHFLCEMFIYIVKVSEWDFQLVNVPTGLCLFSRHAHGRC